MERQFTKKKINVLFHFLFYCFKKSFQKGCCGAKIICGGPCTFDNEKPFAFIICGECMAKMSDITLYPHVQFPSIYIFSHDVLHGLVENNKQTSNICFVSYKGMLMC